jgi:hypothetical protein
VEVQVGVVSERLVAEVVEEVASSFKKSITELSFLCI